MAKDLSAPIGLHGELQVLSLEARPVAAHVQSVELIAVVDAGAGTPIDVVVLHDESLELILGRQSGRGVGGRRTTDERQ
jgi:hypothetical protein